METSNFENYLCEAPLKECPNKKRGGMTNWPLLSIYPDFPLTSSFAYCGVWHSAHFATSSTKYFPRATLGLSSVFRWEFVPWVKLSQQRVASRGRTAEASKSRVLISRMAFTRPPKSTREMPHYTWQRREGIPQTPQSFCNREPSGRHCSDS